MKDLITDASDAKFLALTGYKFNVVDAEGQCFTYVTATPNGQESPHFVRECSEQANDIYIGTVFDMENFRITKAVIDPCCDEVTLFERFWDQAKLPMGDMVGFHAEPYDEQAVSEASPSDTPDIDAKARKHHTATSKIHHLENRVDELHSQVSAILAQVDYIMRERNSR